MGPHTPLLLPPLPALANCHPTPGKGDSREAPDRHLALGVPQVRGFPENIRLGVQAPHWITRSLRMLRVRSREMPPTPFPKSLLQPKPCLWPFQATLGQCQEDPCMIQPKAPQILYTFCKTPNTQSTVRRERPRSSPKCGAGVPTFSVPLLSGASSSEQRSGLLPLLVGGGAQGPTPHPRPYPGASWSGSTPCSLLEHRGRVAGLQLHVSTWAECQGAGPGLGMGPAGETG